MNKKLIILILVVILIGGGISFFFLSKNTTTAPAVVTGTDSPFGVGRAGERAGEPAEQNNNENTNSISVNQDGVVIKKIVSEPVAGFIFIGKGASTTIRYAERGSGRVNDISLGTTPETQKVTGDTQSRIVSAVFLEQGKGLLRFKETDTGSVTALYSKVATSSVSKEISGTILDLDVTADGNKVIFVFEDELGSAITTANGDGTGAQVAWRSSLQEWLVQGLNKNVISIQTKSARGMPGSAFIISGGASELYLSGQSGFRAMVSPDGMFAVFSDYTNTASPVQIYDKEAEEKRGLFLNTLPEKCVWSNIKADGLYCIEFAGRNTGLPDIWYRGEIFLNAGKVWRISAKTNIEESLADLGSLNEAIDAIELGLSSDEQWLGFMNKRDYSLWVIDLSGAN